MRRLSARIVVLAITLTLFGAAVAGAQSLTGQVHSVVVTRGDTLRAIGSQFGVEPRTLAAGNGLTLESPLMVGTTLTVDNRHIVPAVDPRVSIVVNVPQRMLFLLRAGGVTSYPVAVGSRGWQTPIAAFTIVSKETNPTWDVPESIREEARRNGRWLPPKVPPGPDNPLGAYWLGLSIGSVGIHGTNAPTSIFQTVTHGCIRLHPDDVAALFAQVQTGWTGLLVYQPILVAVAGEQVFVEAHRDVYGLGPRDALEFVRVRSRELGVVDRVDWDAVVQVIGERAGVARSVSR